MKSLLLLTISAFTISAFGARVAVTDSGTDFQHEWLQGRELINTKEIPNNMVDDDRNGKVDDVVGWNFAEDYGQVFFREHLNYVDTKLFKIFEILGRIQSETQTREDEQFWKENIQGLPEAEKTKLVNELNFYGQYSHGTHVSGIVAQVSPDSRIMSVRVFPDTPPSNMGSAPRGNVATFGIVDWIYKLLANVSNGTFVSAAAYLKEQNIDVANYSLGVSLQMIAKAALAVKGVKNPTEAQIEAETKRLYAQYEPIGKKWMMSSPNTLFVVASGNDGTNNDKLPAFPANVRIENSITVGATLGFNKLASFSNIGETTVDVMAPGVAVKSSVPSLDSKQVLPMSGTSMAAPYVAGVAARIKDINPRLTPAQIKQILMGTVDKKDWLKGKAVSAGVVNAERAYMAAEKAKSMNLMTAIAAAGSIVPNVQPLKTPAMHQTFSNRRTSPVVQDMKDVARQVVF